LATSESDIKAPGFEMIFELRTYELTATKAQEYLNLFRTLGVEHVTAYLPMGGYFLTETGQLNRIHHIWIYETFAERTAARQALSSDLGWNKLFVPSAFHLIERQRNAFMILQKSSKLLDKVCATRRTQHHAQTPEAQLFGPRLLSLTYSKTPFQPKERLGQWRITSGYAAGSYVTLAITADEDLLTYSETNPLEHELLRPLSCSPLQ
jgi:hypothetical protein